jgi:peptidoglycan/LPS O-acetylase OafA/YrhL
MSRRDSEPIGTSPRVRDQPALTTSSGRSWLLLGGILALIAVVTLVTMLGSQPAGVALIGICVIVALYAAMVIVRVNLHPGRGMLAWLAAMMIAIAVVGLVCVGLIAATAGDVAF